MQQQSYIPSSNGLQSFAEASPDYELAPIGIASMHEQAQKLAEYGRNGDIYVVHAAEGETVIPLEVLNKNPKIKELLFKQMEEMGLDPQEFVVGNELNSINPDTGLPEFFFKSVFRAVKKAVKSVAKVVKKLAPIVLPIAAAAFGVPFLNPTFFGAGSFGASFLGSGLGSLIGGASIKDSLKAALIGGGTAVVTSGLKSEFLTPGGSFSKGVGQSFSNPGAPSFSTQASRFGDIFTGNNTIDSAEAFLMAGPDPTSAAIAPTSATSATSATLPSIRAGGAFPTSSPISAGGGTPLTNQFFPFTPASTAVPVGSIGSVGPTLANVPVVGANANPLGFISGQTGATAKQLTAIDSAAKAAMDAASKDASYFTLGLDNKLLGGPSITMADITKVNPALEAAPGALVKAAASNVNPSMVSRAAVPLAVVAGGASLGGVFDPPPVDNPDRDDLEGVVPSETGYDLFQKDPQKYLVQDTNPYRYDLGNPAVSTRFVADGGYMENPQYMNMGGTPQFPRREMLVEGPGTERSDDIPAMLSDGEFVMNAKAVRGADPSGNGNRQAGASNLYNMMRNFEMRS